MRSEGYIQNASPGHFGIILNASPTPTAALGTVGGRGLIVGNVSGRTEGDGCTNGGSSGVATPRSQFEVWWPTSEPPYNALYPESCSNFTWQDWTWYRVELHVNEFRWMYYSVKDIHGNVLYWSAVQDLHRPGNIEANTGFAFFVIDDNPPEHQWKLRFSDVTSGWFTEGAN